MDPGHAHMIDGAYKSWRERGGKGIPPIILGYLGGVICLVMLSAIVIGLQRLGVPDIANLLPQVPSGYLFTGIVIILLLGIWLLPKIWRGIKNN